MGREVRMKVVEEGGGRWRGRCRTRLLLFNASLHDCF